MSPHPVVNPREPKPAGVSAFLAVVFATISWFALTIAGLGVWSALTEQDIIIVPRLSAVPGVVGVIVALLVFVIALALALRGRPSFLSVPFIGLGTALGYGVAIWLGVLVESGDIIAATAAFGALVTGAGSIVLVAALIAAWGGIALRRTQAHPPRWPWEKE